jgi:hypothetical protein
MYSANYRLDPRQAIGTCAGDGVDSNEFDGTYSAAYMTGGPGADVIPASESAAYPWPPATLTNEVSASMSLLYQYTQTGTPITMPGPTYTHPGSSETINAGNGWFKAEANQQYYAPVAKYVDPSGPLICVFFTDDPLVARTLLNIVRQISLFPHLPAERVSTSLPNEVSFLK